MNKESLLKLREIMEFENIRSVEIKDGFNFQAAEIRINDKAGIPRMYAIPNESYEYWKEEENNRREAIETLINSAIFGGRRNGKTLLMDAINELKKGEKNE